MNAIVKFETPVGVFTVGDDLNVYINGKITYDYDKTRNTHEPIDAAVRYIEEQIQNRMDNKRKAIQAQIDALNDEIDSFDIAPDPSKYRI